MRNIFLMGVAVLALASCKKDRTCSCTGTSTLTYAFDYPAGTYNESGFGTVKNYPSDVTITKSSSETDEDTYTKVSKKSVKQGRGNIEACVGTSSENNVADVIAEDAPGFFVSNYGGTAYNDGAFGEGTKVTLVSSKYESTCKIK